MSASEIGFMVPLAVIVIFLGVYPRPALDILAATILNAQAVSAIMFYLAVYLFMNLGAFLVAIFIHNRYGYDEIEEWKGLGFQAPSVAVAMGIFLFSLTGLPPTARFVGKVYLFSVLIEAR